MRFIYFLLLLFLSFNCFAQQTNTVLKNDTTLVKKLGRRFIGGGNEIPLDSQYIYSKEIYNLTLPNIGKFDKKSNDIYNKAFGRAALNLTTYFLAKVNKDSAKYYLEAIKNTATDSILLGISKIYEMRINLAEKNYKKGLENNKKAQQYFSKSTMHLIRARTELSDIYKETENPNLALKLDSISLTILKKDSINMFLPAYETTKSILYTSYGWSLIKLNRIKEAYVLLKKAEELNKKTNLPHIINLNDLVLSEAYYLDNQLDTAIFYAKKDLNLNEQMQNYIGVFYDKSLLSKIYLKNNELDKALKTALEAEKMFLNHSKTDLPTEIGSRKDIYFVLYKVYKQKGKLQKALEYYEKHITEQNIQKNTTIAALTANSALEIEHEKEVSLLENKQRELKLTNLKQTQRYYLILGIVMFSLLLLFSYFYYKFKKKELNTKLALEAEKNIHQLKTQFTENISHEIRTPVTISLGYLDLMNQNILDPSKLKKYISASINSNKQIIQKADEYLTVLKMKSKNITDKQETKNVIDFFSTIIEPFSTAAKVKNIELFFKSNISSPLYLYYDYDKLEKIISNLITNALKYSPSNTSIYIDIKYSANDISFTIKDQGIGIPMEEQSLIFNRFYQSKKNKISGGLGIGLALVKELVNYLKGTINLSSEINKGSTFTVNLPVAFDKFSNVVTSENPSYINLTLDDSFTTEESFETKKLPKALLVDDNIEMVTYLKEILSPFLNCDFAFNGKEAWEKINNNTNYQIIISDLRMPIMDGIELKQKLNNDTALADIPFIMITANTFSKFKELGFTLGINDYLVKPFTDTEIINRIKNLLENNLIKINSLKESEEQIIIEGSFSELMEKINEIVLTNIDDTSFTIEKLAKECNYSQKQLTRILKNKTGLTPVQIILEIRLQKAYELIVNRTYNSIKEVIFANGFENRSYFNRMFKKRFGVTPSELTSG